MKPKGIFRYVDELGRIVIPKEMRTKLDITTETPLEIHLEGDSIVMKKDASYCVFCGKDSAELDFHGKKLCSACLEELKS